jgi:hypothetical protein
LPEDWEWNFNSPNVNGCGLLMDPNDKLAVFFTFNGKLKGQFGYIQAMELTSNLKSKILGKPIPIRPSVDVDRLFPSVYVENIIVEANFGDDPEGEPFEYDIENCPGLGLACV